MSIFGNKLVVMLLEVFFKAFCPGIVDIVTVSPIANVSVTAIYSPVAVLVIFRDVAAVINVTTRSKPTETSEVVVIPTAAPVVSVTFAVTFSK